MGLDQDSLLAPLPCSWCDDKKLELHHKMAVVGLSVVMGIIVSFFAKGKAALALLGILPLFFVLLAFL